MSDNTDAAETLPPILVVDDSILLRNMLADTLRLAGYEVTTAENGKEALAHYRTSYFPIVITDWVMPEMTGLELCKAIRQDRSTSGYTYVIMLTSQDSKNDIISGLEAGADEYLIKPVHKAELQARLKSARRILELEAARERYVAEIRSMSLVDPLTGVYNRSFMEDRVPKEIKRAYRYQRPLSLNVVGISQFDRIRAEHGHYGADVVLKEVAACITEALRKDIDWMARCGESEFIIALPETSVQDAMIVTKRLRLRIASLGIPVHGRDVKVNACFGIAGFHASQDKQGMTMDTLLETADRFLRETTADAPIKGVQLG